ncbi:MAG: hypothetical protein ACI8UR_001491 [Natronomonas sp.]|jgi:hypothetical protein|uniref:DUF7093 family protein n=1 Tax=Natronomonas sp. TaxID=2184060 RepID=UPI003988DC6C
MGLKCSLLGHDFEPADVEREREKQGSEVVTVVRETEECARCGAERVVSENTEVAAVVDADDVEGDLDEEAPSDTDVSESADATGETGGVSGLAERSGAVDASEEDAAILDEDEDEDAAAAEAAAEAAAAVDELAEGPEEAEGVDLDDVNPEEEDAEILTDEDEPERGPGEWPEETDEESPAPDIGEAGTVLDADEADLDADETESDTETESETLSGITVPEGTIVCPECGFQVDAESSYREGDPCPKCSAWLTAERNR